MVLVLFLFLFFLEKMLIGSEKVFEYAIIREKHVNQEN